MGFAGVVLYLALFIICEIWIFSLHRKLTDKRFKELWKWPVTKGSVVSSNINFHPSYTDEGMTIPDKWDVKIRVSYDVGGNTHSITERWYGEYQKPPEYYPESTVSVYYNPNKPKQAFLRASAIADRKGLGWILLLATLPFVVPVLILLLLMSSGYID